MSHRRAPGWLVAAALVGGACDSDNLVVAPIIDTPAAGSRGAAFPDIDQLELAVARAGDSSNLVSATFTTGATLALTSVPAGDALVVHLTGRFGGTEVAYGRTCAFAAQLDLPAPAPHLWFSRTVHWASAPAPAAPDRTGGMGAAYHDGSAMFIGGVDANDQPIGGIDQFDPRTGEFAALTPTLPRRRGSMALLGDGRVVVFGGQDTAGGTLDTVETIELDALDDSRVETVAEPMLARLAAAVATQSDGKAKVFGGRDGDGAVQADVIEVAGDGPSVAFRRHDATLAVPRAGATATRLSDDLGAPIAVIGGVDASGVPVALAELWKPLREDFTDPATFQPMMLVPRSAHHAVRLPDDSVLIVGGLDVLGKPVRQLELFTTDAGFTDAGLLPADAGVVDATVTSLPDGSVLIAGGRVEVGGPPIALAYIARLNQLDGSIGFYATDALAHPRAGHQATLMCDGTLLVVGGGAASAERYNPAPLGRR